VSYTNAEAREQLLDDFAAAIDQLALALACLGVAYEQLDEHLSDLLEEQLFRPVQLAYGRAKRTHTEFAQRYDQPRRTFDEVSAGVQSQDAKTLIDKAADATRAAGDAIAALQDSMLPVDVGDTELRAGLSEVRTLIDQVPARAHQLVRIVGR
jgi:methionine synthase II (cobalamin-independent)